MAQPPRKVDVRRELAVVDVSNLPAVIANMGGKAAESFVEFFVASIRNPNTRAAYFRAVSLFSAWMEAQGLEFQPSGQPRERHHIAPTHVAAYVEQLDRQRGYSKPTIKQHREQGDCTKMNSFQFA